MRSGGGIIGPRDRARRLEVRLECRTKPCTKATLLTKTPLGRLLPRRQLWNRLRPAQTPNANSALSRRSASLGTRFGSSARMEMVDDLRTTASRQSQRSTQKTLSPAGRSRHHDDRIRDDPHGLALIQSLIPVLTGGLADRYGYKETIFRIHHRQDFRLRHDGNLDELWRVFLPELDPSGVGTAIFKPGIQGTLVKATRPDNSSMAWGIFYQTVNIGGFIGPLLAGLMRKMAWREVFFANAVVICLNFVLLALYREPGKAGRSLATRRTPEMGFARSSLLRESLRELAKPQVYSFLVILSGILVHVQCPVRRASRAHR